jgi:hypothetical protein
MHRFFLVLVAAALALTGCASLYVKRVTFRNHPISVRVISKYIDEDSPLEYNVAFRNIGREIVSFDFTISDEPGVPHVDKNGPNSGLIENLYPGAEVELPNPTKRRHIWATLGTVTYGKLSKEDIARIYSPGAASAPSAATSEAPLF